MSRKNGWKGKGVDLETAELYDKITRLETSILEKIQQLKSTPKVVPCEHVTELEDFSQPYDSNCNYYDKFWRQFVKNELIMKHIQTCQEQNSFLQKKLRKIDKKFQQRKTIIGPYDKKSYKKRSVKWTCKICGDAYLDEDGFLIHMKYQHPTLMGEEEMGHAIEDIFEEEENSKRSL